MLSETVKYLIKKHNISYYLLAKKMGVGLCKLADAFEMSLGELRKEMEQWNN